jgi:hypothetical protein
MVGIDTFLAITATIFFVGLLLALRRISSLKAEVADLGSKTVPEVQRLVTLPTDHVDCVIKCVGCSKYQVHGNQWMSHEDFIERTKQPDVLGGVCPNCQAPSPKV